MSNGDIAAEPVVIEDGARTVVVAEKDIWTGLGASRARLLANSIF